MCDIIKLLPDSIANQIAAGEVIQRPASVVKELLENSIDAGSTEIKLVIKDSGKTLIQVIDNGKGMSETDARMCFERHATSKISSAEELFAIRTKGFRGEALASIAAIAQVEMFSRTSDSELATRLLIEGSEVQKQEFAQSLTGTTFSVKNLFYNVPARRKFLKSDPVEFKHILDEFQRVALAHPDIFFSLNHNGSEIYHLAAGNLRQRLIGIFGKAINDKLVPVEESTNMLSIQGFVGKVEMAKKTAGEQFLFVNQRFIKSYYLNHAIRSAYEQLLQKEQYPSYFLFIEIDPARIDINVHPTKTEIKFEEERLIYNYLKGCVKHALGKYILTPTFDFETDSNFGIESRQASPENAEKQHYTDMQNYRSDASRLEFENTKNWETIYKNIDTMTSNIPGAPKIVLGSEVNSSSQAQNTENSNIREPYQIHQSYIVNHIKSGFILIDQQNAHERILFEEVLRSLQGNSRPIQRELFPITEEFSPAQTQFLLGILDKLQLAGFEVEHFGGNSFIIHGTPAGMDKSSGAVQIIQDIASSNLEDIDENIGIDEKIALGIARNTCIKRGKFLNSEEMRYIIDSLFACETPNFTNDGKKCYVSYSLDELKTKFL
jgi:DNA mismatch repair protein MutL